MINDKFNILRIVNSSDVLELIGYILEDNKDNRGLIIDVANYLFELQYYFIATSLFNKLITLQPNDYLPYYHLARLTLRIKRNDILAKKYIEKAIELNPSDASVRVEKINILYFSGDLDLLERELSIVVNEFKDINMCNSFIGFLLYYEKTLCTHMLENPNYDNNRNIPALLNLQLVFGKYSNALVTKEYLTNNIKMISDSKTDDIILQKRMEKMENIITFHSPGRGGSFFFHSLIDGHEEVYSIPGVFLKGYFDYGVYEMFLSGSKKDFVSKFMTIYEALFDSKSFQSVPGNPMGGLGASCLGQSCGLTTLGENRDISIEIDKNKFSKLLLHYLNKFNNVTNKDLFKLIHLVWEEMRGHNLDNKNTLFYHIHNPNPIEYYNFYKLFPKSKALYIIRNNLQGLESWMRSDFPKVVNIQNVQYDERVRKFKICYARIIGKLSGKLNSERVIGCLSKNVYNVKLEDVKRKSKATMKRVAEFLDINYSKSLLQSEFMGFKFHSNSSKTNPNISEFDTKSIDRKIGIIFSEDDALLLNTVLRPWNEAYEYDEGEFKYISIDEALKLNQNIMGWELKLANLLQVEINEFIGLIDIRRRMVKRALITQNQIREELTNQIVLKPLENK